MGITVLLELTGSPLLLEALHGGSVDLFSLLTMESLTSAVACSLLTSIRSGITGSMYILVIGVCSNR